MTHKRLFQSLIGSIPPRATSREAENGRRAEVRARAIALLARHGVQSGEAATTDCDDESFALASLGFVLKSGSLSQNHTRKEKRDEIRNEIQDEMQDETQSAVTDLRLFDSHFLAQAALYARAGSSSSVVPTLLLAALSAREESEYFSDLFPRIVQNASHLRAFVRAVRSGATGRSSLGSLPKKAIHSWLEERAESLLIVESLQSGNPTLGDVVKMTHPRPQSERRRRLYAAFLGQAEASEMRSWLAAAAEELDVACLVEFLPHILRANVPGSEEFAMCAARRLREQFQKSDETRTLPSAYQTLQALRTLRGRWTAKEEANPAMRELVSSLEDILERVATAPRSFAKKAYVCVDVSGSMQSSVGKRLDEDGGTSFVRCTDAAGLLTGAILRANASSLAEIIPFEQRVVKGKFSANDSVQATIERLTSFNGGGTNCSAALRHLNERNAVGGLVFIISDAESWKDTTPHRLAALQHEWNIFKTRNPEARLALLDLQARPLARLRRTADGDEYDTLILGGFSDETLERVIAFANGEFDAISALQSLRAVETPSRERKTDTEHSQKTS